MNTDFERDLRQAAALYRKGDSVGAAKALGRALDAQPALAQEEAVSRLASRITGLPPEAAVTLLRDVDRRGAFILKHGRRQQPRASSARPLVIVGLVAAIVALGGIGLVVILNSFSGAVPFGFSAALVERRTPAAAPDREYFVAAPGGQTPETGWPTLVIVPDAGQNGEAALAPFRDAAREAGILLIAPTLPEIRAGAGEADFEAARNTLLVVLEDAEFAGLMNAATFPHFLGQVYFGAGVGASFVSWLAARGLDYAETGYAMEMPLGVILADGRPRLFAPSELSRGIPYRVLVSETHPDAALSRDYARLLDERGLRVDLQQLPGDGQTLAAASAALALEWTASAYQPPGIE